MRRRRCSRAIREKREIDPNTFTDKRVQVEGECCKVDSYDLSHVIQMLCYFSYVMFNKKTEPNTLVALFGVIGGEMQLTEEKQHT